MSNTLPGARLVDLGSIAEINPAFPKLSLSKNTEISVLRVESVSEETGLIDPVETRPVSKVSAGATLVRDGDILLAKNSPNIEKGKIAIVSGLAHVFGASHADFHVIRPKRPLSSRWLWHFLRQRAVRNQAEQNMRVIGGKRQVPADFLNLLMIPLPPLVRQKSIVSLLDKVAAARSLQSESILQTDAIVSAVFREMFDEPDKNPRGWDRGPLSGLVEKVLNGASHITLNRPASHDEWAVVTPSSVTSGFFKPDETLALAQPATPQKHLSTGDLLMSWANNSELVGTVALVEENYDKLFLPETLWQLTPRRGVSTAFLKELLSLPSVRQRIRELAFGASTLRIKQSQLLALPIFKPRPQLQARFAKIYWKLSEVKRSQEALRAQLEQLHAALLARVFPQIEAAPFKAQAERLRTKMAKRVSRKKSSLKSGRKRATAAKTDLKDHRLIWSKLSPFQRDVWISTQTFNRPFRVAELTVAVGSRSAEVVSRERILTSVELLVSLGVIIKEGRHDADRWRFPNPETDREIEV